MSDFILILLPGAMYFWVLFVGQSPFQEVQQEIESRVVPRLLACPVAPAHYILAKMLRCFVLCSLAVIVLLISSALLFGVRWGNPWKLGLVIFAWAGSMTGLLAAIYALARSREQANVLSPMVLITCAMLGGSMFPYENLPRVLQSVGQYTPNRWGVLVLQGAAHSKPLSELLVPFIGLLVLGLVGSGASFFLFRRRLMGG
jgi:ABC-2 type transport system permease protein